MTVRVDVEPDLLRWAAGRAGWSDEVIAERAPRFHDWIAGTRPTLKQLENFARKTHTPLGYFFLSEPPEEHVPIPDMRTFRNQAVRQPSADLLDTIYQCQSRQDWYSDFAARHELPEVEYVGEVDTSTPPEFAADRIRQILNFDIGERAAFSSWEDALRQLIDRIEGIGVLVMGLSNAVRRAEPTAVMATAATASKLADVAGAVAVRDSEVPDGPVLLLTRAALRTAVESTPGPH